MLQKAEDGGDFQHTQPIRAGLGAQEKTREVNRILLLAHIDFDNIIVYCKSIIA